MDLIIGGAYQGKLTWAAQHYDLKADDLYDLEKGLPGKKARCLYHLEALTWQAAKSGKSPEELLAEFLPCLAEDGVVIAREIGSGVVPMDPVERLWRELHGSVVKALALRAGRVSRIFCGLEERLK